MKDLNDYDTRNVVLCFLLLCASIAPVFTIIGQRIKIDREIYLQTKDLSNNTDKTSFVDLFALNSHGTVKENTQNTRRKFKQFDVYEDDKRKEREFDEIRKRHAEL